MNASHCSVAGTAGACGVKWDKATSRHTADCQNEFLYKLQTALDASWFPWFSYTVRSYALLAVMKLALYPDIGQHHKPGAPIRVPASAMEPRPVGGSTPYCWW